MNKQIPIDFSPSTVPLRRTVWLIFLCAALILLVLAGRNSLQGSEGEIAESVRQLLSGKDIFVSENWQYPVRYDQLWFARGRMLPALIFGNSEAGIRIFSALSALILLGGVMLLAADFFDRRTMYTGAWMLIGAYGFVYWGRFAGGAITLTSWIVWSVVILRYIRKTLLWQTLFFLIFFSGCIWWGMNYIAAVPAIVLIAYPEIRQTVFNRKAVLAIFIGVLLTVSISMAMIYYPGIPLCDYPYRFYRLLSGSFAESWQITVSGGSGALNIKQLLNLFRMLMPWTLPVFCAVAGMICRWRELSGEHKRLFGGCLLLWLSIGVYPLRHWQYQLGLMPFFILLGAAGVTRSVGIDKWQLAVDKIMNWSAMIVCSFAVSVIAVWPLWKMVFKMPMPWWIVLGMPLLGLLGLICIVFDTGSRSSVERVSGMRGRWSGYTLAWVCLSSAVFTVGIPVLSDYRTGKPFWQQCGSYAAQYFAGEVIYYGGIPDAEELFYMNLPEGCTAAENPEALRMVLSRINGNNALIIVRAGDINSALAVIHAAGWQCDTDHPLAEESGAMQFTAVANFDIRRCFMYRLFRGH